MAGAAAEAGPGAAGLRPVGFRRSRDGLAYRGRGRSSPRAMKDRDLSVLFGPIGLVTATTGRAKRLDAAPSHPHHRSPRRRPGQPRPPCSPRSPSRSRPNPPRSWQRAGVARAAAFREQARHLVRERRNRVGVGDGILGIVRLNGSFDRLKRATFALKPCFRSSMTPADADPMTMTPIAQAAMVRTTPLMLSSYRPGRQPQASLSRPKRMFHFPQKSRGDRGIT